MEQIKVDKIIEPTLSSDGAGVKLKKKHRSGTKLLRSIFNVRRVWF